MNGDKSKQFSTLIMTKGCPASSKTTWAKEQVQKNPFKMVRICRDDFRTILNNYTFSEDNEALVTSLRDQAIKTALLRGYDVVVDETNLDKLAFGKMVKLVQKLNINCHIMEKPFYLPFEDLVARNAARDRVVPDNVMKKMWSRSGGKKFKHYEARSETVISTDNSDYYEFGKQLKDESLPKCVIVDLDGTISLFNEPDKNKYDFAHTRNPYNASTANEDSPNEPVVSFVNLFHDAGHKIVFCSGREDRYKSQTIEFLSNNLNPNVKYELYMRATGDTRKDWVIKEKILKDHIHGKYKVFVCLDDRDMMVEYYRKLGIPTWQVNEGNF